MKNESVQPQLPPLSDSDGPCEKCGHTCECWFTDSRLWNQVNGGETGLLCLRCFVGQAEAIGVKSSAWRLELDAPSSTKTQLPPLDSGLVDFPLRDNAADVLNQVALRQCRERQLLSALADNESLKERLSNANEEAERFLTQADNAEGNAVYQQRRAEKAEAEREQALELIREYRAMHNYSDVYEHQTDDEPKLCPTCIKADTLLKEKRRD